MTKANRTTTVLLGILTTIMVGWVLHVGAAVLQPLVIALLLASMLQPVVAGLARWRIPPAVTVILMVTLIFFGLARVGILLQTNIAAFLGPSPSSPEQVEPQDPTQPPADLGTELAGPVPPSDGTDRAPDDMGESTGEEGARYDPVAERQEDLIKDAAGWETIKDGVQKRMAESSLPGPLVGYLGEALDDVDLAGLATGLIGGGFDFTKGLLLVVIYMLFIFAEQAVFRRKILSVAGSRRGDAAKVLDTIGKGIQRYLGVKTLVSFATGAICYAVLVALDIPFALLFGFMTFLLNYIPTFGSIIAGILPVTTALADGSSLNRVMVIFFTYLSVNVVLGSFLEPRILGRELNLSPLVIIISVVVWAALWGIVGTFLAVPLTAAAQIILASQENTRPIAVLLSSGPPRERPPLRLPHGKRSGRAHGSTKEPRPDAKELDVNAGHDGA